MAFFPINMQQPGISAAEQIIAAIRDLKGAIQLLNKQDTDLDRATAPLEHVIDKLNDTAKDSSTAFTLASANHGRQIKFQSESDHPYDTHIIATNDRHIIFPAVNDMFDLHDDLVHQPEPLPIAITKIDKPYGTMHIETLKRKPVKRLKVKAKPATKPTLASNERLPGQGTVLHRIRKPN